MRQCALSLTECRPNGSFRGSQRRVLSTMIGRSESNCDIWIVDELGQKRPSRVRGQIPSARSKMFTMLQACSTLTPDL